MQKNSQSLQFYVLPQPEKNPANTKGWSAYLDTDYWDDWGKYRTQFSLTVVDPKGKKHQIGQVKIGSRGLKPHASGPNVPPGHRYPDLEKSFSQLDIDKEFFSLGQDEEYYSNLNTLGDPIREQILVALRDVAWDNELWKATQDEIVMGESLLRYVTHSTVEGQFRRMARGDARVTSYKFSYAPPKRLGDGSPPFKLQFSVNPRSPIPTNVHVLIGRNGVGKTRLLSLMTKALVAKDATAKQSGKFELSEEGTNSGKFANVVAVSFSAFDEAELLPDRGSSPDALGFSFIGLRGWTSDSPTATIKPKSPQMLATEFCNSLKECRIGVRRRRWAEVIGTLQSDPVFKAAQLTDMIEADISEEDELEGVLKTFKALSSGHKIVLLTLTRLVEKVEERTLVLIDEPEAHLHPPLLSAMTRAISELLVKRNGVAIVATHSPIILQEVPKSCVWIINRILTSSKAERPTIETFGESVGILSREVFQLELSQSGYHHILNDARREATTYKEAIELLGNQLGAEAKAVLRAMYLSDES
ncbi:AAA family ATPase [Janthinobacterium sp. GMG2]|uniref:AAA family ATPase n=1 Tax=Janthinobacterium sp. GMG2 TaxID=3096606 RepID=UPI0029F5AA58|nr:AAA family ATPase [Janthinobacterium sp. GMG2]MDX8124411.1 AAA family ATPase [Janthinobacterium sp. GMG2]